MVLVGVEKLPKARIMGLFAAFICRGFTIHIDCTLLCLLGVLDGQVAGPLNECMHPKHLTVILILVAGLRRMVMGRRRMTAHLAETAPLGGLSNLLPLLASLLPTRIHA
jgi:hypothetical protein